MRKESITFIIPVYNEAALLETAVSRTLQALSRDFNNFEIIIVDDGSTDKTAEVCTRLAASDSRIRILSNDVNLNVGISIQRAFAIAKMDFVTHSAADLCLGPESIASLLNDTANWDVLVLQRKSHAGYEPWRFLTSMSNRMLLKLLFPKAGAGITDFNFSQIYRGGIIRKLIPLAKSPAFTTPEMILRARYTGCRVKTARVIYEPRKQGKGAFGKPHDMIWSFYDMLRFRIRAGKSVPVR
jgi:glycosyltransferase involved in cell wall biosynthesis